MSVGLRLGLHIRVLAGGGAMNPRPGTLPSFLEARIARIERRQQILANALDIDLDAEELKRSPSVRHQMPATAAEYDAYIAALTDEMTP